MNTHFKVFASYNSLQYLCDFIHVLMFVTVSKCRKSPKLTNIVINGKGAWGLASVVTIPKFQNSQFSRQCRDGPGHIISGATAHVSHRPKLYDLEP
jgi:hypothetical protein